MKTMLQWGLLLTVALPLFANSSWESLRRAALERRRMVIYNTDGCDAGVYFPRNLAATPENFLSRRLIHVRGSQVDSVFYCPISSGFGNFTCRLKTADWFIKDAPMYPKFRNISRDLNRLGTDPLRLAGEFCRREKLEFFVSIRVNDTHDAAGTLENPHHLLPKFKQEHPEFLMGTPDRRPPYCSWSAVDFSHPEVRARMRNFVREFAAGENSEVFVVCAQIEQEIAELDDDEKKMFLEDLGLKESGLEKLIKASYHILGLISYLTAGEPEVRAWTITRGTKAPQAAGKIHTDFERGFIRAEVVSYDDLIACGSHNAAKEKGLIRLEGKDYVVQDGDIMLFRFNV